MHKGPLLDFWYFLIKFALCFPQIFYPSKTDKQTNIHPAMFFNLFFNLPVHHDEDHKRVMLNKFHVNGRT